MGLKLIVTTYFTLVLMVFALGVIALSLDETHDSRAEAPEKAYLSAR